MKRVSLYLFSSLCRTRRSSLFIIFMCCFCLYFCCVVSVSICVIRYFVDVIRRRFSSVFCYIVDVVEFACMMRCGTVDCLSPNCSGHGVCVGGECLCYAGYHGFDCSSQMAVADGNGSVLCVRDCRQHGMFDLRTQTCVCQSAWTGLHCETGASSTTLVTL